MAIILPLRKLFPIMRMSVFLICWCLPIPLFISIVHGQNDAIVAALAVIAFTCVQAAFACVLFSFYRSKIRSNRTYRADNRPIFIGIAGDSGAGKNTLAGALRNLTGVGNSLQIDGDDYHRWERGDKAWERTTHLNPNANHLLLPVEHAIQLSRGQTVKKPVYDHDTGKFTDPRTVKPRKFTFFVGLHTLSIFEMRRLLKIKIYMDPEEGLRRHWKINRDVTKRSYSKDMCIEQIRKRAADSEKFVRPQKQFADWTITYLPAVVGGIPDYDSICTKHVLKDGVPLEKLVDALRSIPALEVERVSDPVLGSQSIVVKGEASEKDVKEVASKIFPNLYEAVPFEKPIWMAGNYGVSQLVFMILLESHLRGPSEETEIDGITENAKTRSRSM